jgi:hypothetical protein
MAGVVKSINRRFRKAMRRRFPQLHFLRWRHKNPGKSFKEYYVESVLLALHGDKKHASLGSDLSPRRLAHARWTFARLLELGIQPSDVVVDYGCGTLRVGRLFIDFLNPDKYIGLDVDERILEAASDTQSPDIHALKRPTLEVITSLSVERAAARRPRWLLAKGVIQHVPPEGLPEFFGNISQLVGWGGTAIVVSRFSKRTRGISAKSWLHSKTDLEAIAATNGLAPTSLRLVSDLDDWSAVTRA